MTQQLEWKYQKRPVSVDQIQALEESLGVNLPLSYKALLQYHHGARPSKKRFDTTVKKGYVVKTFLPIVEKGNVIDVLNWLKGRLPAKLLPFASDAAGNYVCFDFTDVDLTIVLWKHETLTTEHISFALDSFLSNLY